MPKSNLLPPFLRDLYFSLRVQLEEITVTVSDSRVKLLVPASYAKSYRADDGKGQFSGYDSLGRYEFSYAKMLDTLISPGQVVFDIGASYGLYSIYCHSVHAARVHAFEVDPFCSWVLRQNSKKYCRDKIHIYNRKIGNVTNHRANQVNLDDFCRKTGLEPNLVKMDVEGFEYFIIKGMREVLCSCHPTILMEFHQRKMTDIHNVPFAEITDQLRGVGYSLTFNGHHWYTAQSEGKVDVNWHAMPPNACNYAMLAVWKSDTP